MAQRDIIDSPEEHDAVTRAHVRSALAREALTAQDIDQEIKDYEEWERENPLDPNAQE